MNIKICIVGACAFGFGIALGYMLKPVPAQPALHTMPDDTQMQSGMHAEMNTMTVGLAGKTGDAFDEAFLSEMIVHHEGAVAMAEAALQNAAHAEIKDMAQSIISAQTAEISQMRAWLLSWYGI